MREMKDSGIEWIGEIPKDWRLTQARRLFNNKKEIVGDAVDQYERLALTLNGIIKRSKEDSEGLQPEKFEGYQILRKNNLVFKMIDLQNVNTVELAFHRILAQCLQRILFFLTIVMIIGFHIISLCPCIITKCLITQAEMVSEVR